MWTYVIHLLFLDLTNSTVSTGKTVDGLGLSFIQPDNTGVTVLWWGLDEYLKTLEQFLAQRKQSKNVSAYYHLLK